MAQTIFETTKPYLVIQGLLLEGPLYDEKTKQCRFIDIVDHKLYTFDPLLSPEDAAKALDEIDTDETLGVTASIRGLDDKYVVAARRGFAVMDTKTGQVDYIKEVEGASDDATQKLKLMRFNDGAVDSRGRFWAGTMNDPLLIKEDNPDGTLYRLDPDLSIHAMLDGATSPNGIGWNKADTLMYWTDSATRSIFSFDFDADTGTISGRKLFWNTRDAGFEEVVAPDGLVVDEEDCVWSALWRGFKVVRINPQGQIIGEVRLPTAYATCPAFFGTELIITTARDPSVKEEGIRRGGDIYRVDVRVCGLVKHEFHMVEGGK